LAAQDLIISRRSPAATSNYLDADPNLTEPMGPDGPAVVFATLRKRWLLLFVIALVSAGMAALAAWLFSRQTATIKAAIIYTGLPNASTSSAFDPLGAATGAEMIASVKVLKQLLDRRGLDIPPTKMAEYITTSVGRSSSLINLSLAWNDPEDGISMVNDLMNVFIEEMALQRKSILKQHLEHLNLALIEARNRVDEARSQYDALLTKKTQQLDKGGLTSEKYKSMLSNADTTKSKILDQRTNQLTTNEQITQVKTQIDENAKKKNALGEEVKATLLREASAVIAKARGLAAPSSSTANQIQQTIIAISKLNKSPDTAHDFDQWQKRFYDITRSSTNGLSDKERQKLDETFSKIQKENEVAFQTFDTERRHDEGQLRQYQLQSIAIKNVITMLEKQQAEFEKQANTLGEQITGISSAQIEEAKHAVDEAAQIQDNMAVQANSLRQLSETRLREWTVTVPASPATTQVDSNKSKLFILIFGVCCLALSFPLFVAEWHAQSDSPQVQMARSLRVPVLAERILEHFSPQARKGKAAAGLIADQMETIRMLTLRIQQSCHRPGSVVLFSSLDPSFSAAPLMATVAECLADREERVLLVDAVCPQRALLPVLNVLTSNPTSPEAAKGKHADAAKQTLPIPEGHTDSALGLSEYLSEECEEVGELVRPTGCPGVDLIASGRRGFPREAMASSCLTELLNSCRKNYTMVLVHGPAVDLAADLQMLTARADGIVLAATKNCAKDPYAREFVQDLLDLGAPLIGLVA
jgi:Mrp family chromosome partitioning ATPase/cell division protein FtsL